jgi:hypothetical protein
MSAGAGIAASLPVAEALSHWATAAGIVVALVAGIAALTKYYVDRRRDHWKYASDLYGNFMDTALAHPQFYPGCWPRICKDPMLENQYSYFVGKFLWTCEAIILGRGYDSEWRDCLKVIMREHVDYLVSERFGMERGAYDRRIIAMIDEVVSESSRAELAA